MTITVSTNHSAPRTLADMDLDVLESLPTMPTRELRAWAADVLPDYNSRTTIATLPLTAEMVNHPGALTELGKIVDVIKKAYADREPVIMTRYSEITILVWESDDTLRSHLKYARER